MGYDLHITRATEDWSENEGNEITLEEWLNLVRTDPELTIDDRNGERYALWSGPSEYPEPWIAWFNGNLYTKNPDRALLSKMLQIAQKLGAKVQGDDGEEYQSPEDL